MWNGQIPVTYQRFVNTNFQKDVNVYSIIDIVRLFTFHTVHKDLAATWKRMKHTLKRTIYPTSETKIMCTMMLLYNLASPEWISIYCSDTMLGQALCRTDKYTTDNFETHTFDKNCHCLMFQTLKISSCVLFVWKHKTIQAKETCKWHRMDSVKIENVNSWLYFLLATNIPLSPILASLGESKARRHQYLFMYNKVMQRYVAKSRDSNMYEGYQLCASDMLKIQVGSGLFSCKNTTFISNLFVCDGDIDCPNNDISDEKENVFCAHFDAKNTQQHSNNKTINATENKPKCSPLYYVAASGSCVKFTRLMPKNSFYAADVLNKSHYTCEDNSTIDIALVDDLHSDCGPNADDEPILKSLLVNDVHFRCENQNQVPCHQGHPQCYNLHDTCVYKIKGHGHLVPCRNGGHIENCEEFDCNLAFKCSWYYCIPWEYVCDNNWDCPAGTDESQCQMKGRCDNMFKCKGSDSCIYLGSVCDSNKNCPNGDDELLCELKGIACPENCQCLALAMVCSNISSLLQVIDRPFMFVSICCSGNLTNAHTIQVSPNARYVMLRNNNVSDICGSSLSKELLLFDIAFNQISGLKKQCFSNRIVLKMLVINDNHISYLQDKSLSNVLNLTGFNLSNNNLIQLSKHTFSNLTYLKILSIRNNPLTHIHQHAFRGLKLEAMESTNYQICCILDQRSKCHAQKHWSLSCSDLLPTKSLKLHFLSIFATILFLNCCSVFLHILSQKSKKQYAVIVIAVNLTDLLFAEYLCTIWAADTHFAGRFVVVETIWRSGLVCFSAFAGFLCFSILTPLVLFFLSFSRLMVVIHPMDSNFKRTTFVLKNLFSIFLLSVALSSFFVFFVQLTEDKLPTSLCLPFADPTDKILMIKYVAWCVAVIQVITSVVIAVTHIMLIKNLFESQQNIRKSKSDDKSNKSFLIQLFAITTSNVLCWVPTNSIYIMCTFLSEYPIELLMWTITVATPLDSLTNPLVFVITSLRGQFREKLKKKKQ